MSIRTIILAMVVVGGIAVGWLWVGIQRASRMACTDCELKQLALAFSTYQSAHGAFPARAIFSKDGKPLLSWRVALLPFMAQEQLFARFHLDEPWNSEHNKMLIAEIPYFYHDPRADGVEQGRTTFVVPAGKDTIFAGDKACKIDEITDGTSNTILLVEAGPDKAVMWTKPDDWDFDPRQPLAGLGTLQERFYTAFADGSIHQIDKTIDPDTSRWLILRNDGHAIDPAKF